MMKPRLESAPMTDDDINIGVWLMARWLVRFGEARLNCELAQDERDAQLMLVLRVQAEMGPCYLRIGADNYAVPAIQVHVRRNPLFPTGARYPFNITPAHKGQ